MPSTAKNTKTNINIKPRKIAVWKIVAAVVASLLVLWLAFDLYLGGNIAMYRKWNSCGREPVEAYNGGYDIFGSTPASSFIDVPYYFTPKRIALVQTGIYFCTPHEAELHGYSANPNYYEFKHTTPDERNKSYNEGNMSGGPYTDPKYHQTQ